MPVKDVDILKTLLLTEEETETLPQGFEDDPMGFILKKYQGLNTVMEYMMTESFREYVDAIFIVAPKPTTFKVLLHNGQFFFLQFMGKAYQATVQGKNYYLMSIGEKERCMLAIARLLRYGNPLKTKGPEGAEQGTRPEGETGGEGGETGGEGGAEVPEATPSEEGGEEGGETLEEAKILESILKKSLFEKEVVKNADIERAKSTKYAVNKILTNNKAKDEYGLTAMSSNDRIANNKKITEDQFIDLIKSIFGKNIQIAVYKPGEGPNTGSKGSTKFKMYEFSPEPDSVPARIILAGGANEGEKFEASLFNSMKAFAGQPKDSITDPLIKQLYEKLGIDPSKISPNDVTSTGKINTNRSLDWSGPKNVGEKISDITIKKGNKNYYLSIKNEDGGTFYNGGTIPFIVEDKDGNIKYLPSKRNNKPELDRLFKDLGIDPNKIIKGLKQYKKEGKPSEYETIMSAEQNAQNLEEFKKFLASGYGYGYWYVRKKKGGDLFVKYLSSAESALDMVGNISEVQIKYPGTNTKSTTIKVITDDESMIDTDYVIELRNERGDILPLSVKMKSTN